MLAALPKNDKKARVLILTFSIIVFVAVTALERVTLDVDLGFDPHVFAAINAIMNSIVSVLLIAGIITAKRGKYKVHKNIMLAAMVLSVLFLVSYILHHLFAGSTLYGDLDHNGVVSDIEKAEAGTMRYVYMVFLGTHIILAGVSLPYILFTAYRALINENVRHRKLAKITWPMWFYVAVTGPIVYWMISAYYQ
jgi:putative membrane protein